MPITRQAKLDQLLSCATQCFWMGRTRERELSCPDADIRSVPDLITMNQADLEVFEVKESETVTRTLRRSEMGMIKSFQSYLIHKEQAGEPVGPTQYSRHHCRRIDEYRASARHILVATGSRVPPPIATSATLTHTRDAVSDFKKGAKRDVSLYPTLKDEKQWDNWNRTTKSLARTQDVIEVFDANFIPLDADAQALFTEKKKFVYAVFERCILTDTGKSIVREHADTFNAQKVYKLLQEHHSNSTSATISSGELLKYITSARLDDGKSWRGSLQGFILHWMEQVRLYHNMIPASQHLSDTLQRTMLQNAVHGYPELRAVDTQAQQFKTQTGNDLTFLQVCQPS